jgi:hypothetical protein
MNTPHIVTDVNNDDGQQFAALPTDCNERMMPRKLIRRPFAPSYAPVCVALKLHSRIAVRLQSYARTPSTTFRELAVPKQQGKMKDEANHRHPRPLNNWANNNSKMRTTMMMRMRLKTSCLLGIRRTRYLYKRPTHRRLQASSRRLKI